MSAEASVLWSANGWATQSIVDTSKIDDLDLWSADLESNNLPVGSAIEFTLFWKAGLHWEGRNFEVELTEH